MLQVALEDPKRFRIEMAFSRGADLSPLEVMQLSNKKCKWFASTFFCSTQVHRVKINGRIPFLGNIFKSDNDTLFLGL